MCNVTHAWNPVPPSDPLKNTKFVPGGVRVSPPRALLTVSPQVRLLVMPASPSSGPARAGTDGADEGAVRSGPLVLLVQA